MPVARILLFALALTHVVGLADLAFGDTCEETCRDDDCADDLPGADCRCHCPSTMPAIRTTEVVATIVMPSPAVACAYDRQAHASPDPREILHVPRRSV